MFLLDKRLWEQQRFVALSVLIKNGQEGSEVGKYSGNHCAEQ
jgi:hypothetical protein